MIPGEAVEAAARAIWFAGRDGQRWAPVADPLCDMVVTEARLALEAAAPHMLAEAESRLQKAIDDAWRDGYKAGQNDAVSKATK